MSADGGADSRQALAAELAEIADALPGRIDIDPEGVERDLSKLVLTLVELLRQRLPRFLRS